MEEQNTLVSLIEEMSNSIIESEAKDLGINVELEGFKITNAEQANFFLRRLEEVTKERDKINETCDREIKSFNERVNAFRESKAGTLNNTLDFFHSLLESYAKQELVDSKKKSISLPFGTLQFKTPADSYKYDEKEMLKYLEGNKITGYTRTKSEINKNDLKADFVIKGEDVYFKDKKLDEVELVKGVTKFSVKLK